MHPNAQRGSTLDGRGGGGSSGLPVRVVLVGQTGLDLPLRLDPGIELRRVPTAVHAIGEAAEPIASGVPGAGAVTVILSPETDPKETSADFVHNLQAVRPGARILRLLSPDETTGGADDAGLSAADAGGHEYDGTIRFGTPADEIRRLVRDVHRNVAADAPAARPAAVVPPTPVEVKCEPASRDGVGSCGDTDECALVQATLMGRDILLPAMDVIRRRIRRDDVSFVPVGAEATSASSDARAQPSNPGVGVSVSHNGVTFGRLMSPTVDRGVLAEHAAWLAMWLALRNQQEELRQAAFTDDLTGAWNRRYCERFLGTAVAQAAATRGSVTVLVFDIDDFKKYNDRYGHAAGDDILRETVRLLKSVIRPTDRVCRVGGDEFVVIFHEPQGPREAGSKPPASISDIAHRFQRQICEHRFPKLAEKAAGTLTISGGLATFPWDGRTTQELIERADQLAMQSKLQGKNAITFGPGANRVCGRE